MANIVYIQEQMQKFEEYKNNEKGALYLENVMEEITEILENPCNDKDALFANNMLRVCHELVKEIIGEVVSKGTPSIEELRRIDVLVKLFVEGQDLKDAFYKACKLYVSSFSMSDYRRDILDKLIVAGIDEKIAIEILVSSLIRVSA